MRVALTSVDSWGSIAYCRAITDMAEQLNVEIIGLANEKVGPWAPYVDFTVKMPAVAGAEYVEYIADLCNKLSIDKLIPLGPDLLWLEANRPLLGSVLHLSKHAAILLDKEAIHKLIVSTGAKSPIIHKTWPNREVVWKPRVACTVSPTRIDDEKLYKSMGNYGIIMDNIHGQYHAVDVLCTDGKLIAASQQQVRSWLGQVPIDVTVSSVPDHIVAQIASFVDIVSYDGMGCFQYIKTANNDVYWISLAPYPGPSMLGTVEAELNIPALHLAGALGHTVFEDMMDAVVPEEEKENYTEILMGPGVEGRIIHSIGDTFYA